MSAARMHPGRRRAYSAIAAAVGLALAAAGCKPGPRDRYGYSLDVPSAWKRWTGPEPTVPGDVLEAYEVPPPDPAPGEAASRPGSFVVFRSPHAPETTSAQLLTATHYLVLNLPTLRIESERGPMKMIPAASHASAKSSFSERKP